MEPLTAQRNTRNRLQIQVFEDLQKNFADIEKQQDEALEDAHEADVVPILRNQSE